MASPSLLTRIAVAKLAGLAIGVAGFVLLPDYLAEPDPLLRWGFLFWYATVGAMIGLAGVFEHHPVLGLRLRWWVRGPLIAAWMNVNLGLIAHEPLTRLSELVLGLEGPGLMLLGGAIEGLLVGAVIGGLATLAGGEGPATVRR